MSESKNLIRHIDRLFIVTVVMRPLTKPNGQTDQCQQTEECINLIWYDYMIYFPSQNEILFIIMQHLTLQSKTQVFITDDKPKLY